MRTTTLFKPKCAHGKKKLSSLLSRDFHRAAEIVRILSNREGKIFVYQSLYVSEQTFSIHLKVENHFRYFRGSNEPFSQQIYAVFNFGLLQQNQQKIDTIKAGNSNTYTYNVYRVNNHLMIHNLQTHQDVESESYQAQKALSSHTKNERALEFSKFIQR